MGAAALAVAAVAAVCAIALAAWIVATLGAARRPRVVCLMYHRVAKREAWERTRGTERVFTLPTDAFEAQIRWLRERGFTFAGADDVAAHARGERSLPDGSVLLTVDDGCASGHREILPVLLRHGARAAFFVTTDPESPIFRLGGEAERRMTDAELRALADAGMDVGSHAVSHRPLSGLGDDEVRRELAESKRALESALGRPVRHFAVPGNWYDERVLRIAREVGFETAFCSRPDGVRRGSGAFAIPRVNVEGQQGLQGFRRTLSPGGVAARRLVAFVRALPKRIVGPRVWGAVRGRVLRPLGAHRLSPSRMAAAAGVAVAVGLAVTIAWLAHRS